MTHECDFDSRDKRISQLTNIKQTGAMFKGDNKLAANKVPPIMIDDCPFVFK